MIKRLEKLKLLNPLLHEHYKTRIEAMDFTSQTAHEKLAILEIYVYYNAIYHHYPGQGNWKS